MLTGPASGFKTTDTTPTVTWNSVLYGSSYEIQIATDSAFTQNLQTLTSSASPFTFSTLSLGKYYWRVRAINVNSQPGKWSTARYFTIIP